MAPLELLAAVWKFISETKWLSSDNDDSNKSNRVALVIPRPNETESQTIAACRQAQLYATSTAESPLSATHDDPPTLLECFQQWTPGPILLNSQMTCNLWGNMSRSFCRHLQQAASKSLDCLHHHSSSSSHVIWPFSYLFLQEARFYSAMHAVMRIPFRMFRDDATDLGISETVVELLYEALGNRVTLIRVLTTGNGPLEIMPNPSGIPMYYNTSEHQLTNTLTTSPSTGQEDLVLGFVLNSTTCHRLVDRGPPAEDAIATQKFIQLWGPKAQLRRFKDGAIVYAVVWNHEENDETSACSIRMQHAEKTQGAIVEQIVRHVLNLHFFQQHATLKVNPQFALRDMVSLVDGVANSTQNHEEKLVTNATAAFKSAMSAFESLSEFLRHNSSPTIPVEGSADAKTSRLGVPLAIDAVEPLSPTLRYSELFPPLPHSSLGGPRVLTGKKVSGVAPPPILIQIRFGLSSKWPTDLRAMGAAKTAMLIQLANGIESMKHAFDFDGPIHVTPSYMDVGYKGYLWRITVRADPELNMLRKLQQPSPEAVSLLRVLTRDHVVSATHHSMIHAINTAHPSSSSVVRLAKRWTAAHLLSDLIPFEAIELLVAKVYTNRDVPLDPPTTVVSGFLRFLFLLASHNWKRYVFFGCRDKCCCYCHEEQAIPNLLE
jgi:U3 small nucleolar RNA-associated protein 22